MVGYYDFILALIPVTLVGITGLLTAIGLGLTAAVPIAAVVSGGLVGHAMFVNAPVGDETAGRSSFQPAD